MVKRTSEQHEGYLCDRWDDWISLSEKNVAGGRERLRQKLRVTVIVSHLLKREGIRSNCTRSTLRPTIGYGKGYSRI